MSSLRRFTPAFDLSDLDLPGAASGGVGGVKIEREGRRVRALIADVYVHCGMVLWISSQIISKI